MTASAMRAAIFLALQGAGYALSIADLAAQIGTTPRVLRPTLSGLERDGLVVTATPGIDCPPLAAGDYWTLAAAPKTPRPDPDARAVLRVCRDARHALTQTEIADVARLRAEIVRKWLARFKAGGIIFSASAPTSQIGARWTLTATPRPLPPGPARPALPAPEPPPPATGPRDPAWLVALRRQREEDIAQTERVLALLRRHPEIAVADLAVRRGHTVPGDRKGAEPRPLPADTAARLDRLESQGRAVPLDPPSAGYARRWRPL